MPSIKWSTQIKLFNTKNRNKIMTAKEKQKQSDLQRIKRVMNFYYNRGCNKESVNRLYYKILKDKFK
jgi:hypothetical protein